MKYLFLISCVIIFTKSFSQEKVFIDESKNHYYTIVYDENGTKFISYYLNNITYKFNQYSKDGKLISVVFLDSTGYDEKYKEEFFENKKLRLKEYIFGLYKLKGSDEDEYFLMKDGYYVDYYDNGLIKEEHVYINGKINGVNRKYYPNGQLEMEKFYYNGVEVGISRYFDLNGNVIKSDTLFLPYIILKNN